jgi:hydrogenase assembly chaperone HypC/HupF
MCVAAPGKVIKVEGKKAMIKYPGKIVRQALITDEKVKIGSKVLVQMGIIIEVLSEKEASLRSKAF